MFFWLWSWVNYWLWRIYITVLMQSKQRVRKYCKNSQMCYFWAVKLAVNSPEAAGNRSGRSFLHSTDPAKVFAQYIGSKSLVGFPTTVLEVPAPRQERSRFGEGASHGFLLSYCVCWPSVHADRPLVFFKLPGVFSHRCNLPYSVLFCQIDLL